MKLFIGIPSSGTPAKPFVESLGTLDIPKSVSSVDRAVVTGNYVPAQRELIVRRALDRGADVLLMCDDDMILQRDALTQLLDVLEKHPECALAGALYYSRDGFRPMAVDNWHPDNTTTAQIPAFDRAPIVVDGVGFGCVVVRLDAVRALTTPYFEAQVFMEPATMRARICNEDYLFCARLRSGGHTVVLHAGVRCGHYDRASATIQPVTWERPDATSHARMAVTIAGTPQLIPVGEATESGERHERAAVTYVWSED